MIEVEASTLVTGTTVDLTARGRVLIPVPPPVVPPPVPPPDYVPIVIVGEQILINEKNGPPEGINPPTLPLVKTGIVTSDGKPVA